MMAQSKPDLFGTLPIWPGAVAIGAAIVLAILAAVLWAWAWWE